MAPGPAETATDVVPNRIEAHLAGGILALNRFLMTLQNKRMPVADIKVDAAAEGTRVEISFDCPEETARRYATLLENLEDVQDLQTLERPPHTRDGREARYDGRRFAPVENSATGEIGPGTVFHYHQDGDVVWATYEGGAVEFGVLVARVDAEGRLDARYGHLNDAGELMTGECRSTPETLPDGRVRLREEWRWTSGDCSSGRSVVEEIREE